MSDPLDEFAGIVQELSPAPRAEQAFLRLAHLPHCLFLDSARRDPELGRYSFITADPFDCIDVGSDGAAENDTKKNSLECVRLSLGGFKSPTLPDLPPFQGGAAGMFSYELGRQFERVPRARVDEFRVPVIAIGLYDVVLAIDHLTDRAWIISQGFPEQDWASRHRRAVERANEFRDWLLNVNPHPSRHAEIAHDADPVAESELAQQFDVTDRASWAGLPLTSDFSPESYLEAVRRAIEYIHAGDIFQVNLSQRLLCPASDDPIALYLRLRRRNPATFAGYFDLGEFQIASASPERFLCVLGDRVETRPIKGTRRRRAQPEADLFAGDELRQSEKDNAENVMIVDLLRNDLSRVCRPDSVVVSDLCRLESYEFVQHLVSVVRGQLSPGKTAIDLLAAAFPGGSITGAPKVRAMEIIAELEPTARGVYCGALGYLGFDGSMDLNIPIRTITVGRGWWQMPVGGGIVSQSSSDHEYQETWHKAEGLLRSLR